jgi:hypothetical protein
MVLSVFAVAIALVVGLAIVIGVNRSQFGRRVAREERSLLEAPGLAGPPSGVADLPGPVARYRELAVGNRSPVASLRMFHGGTFRTGPNAKAAPIRGTQLFTANPPGFVWTGRIQMTPGVWVDARDMLVAGQGSMRVLVDDTLTLVDARGPELDQGSALRLLAEMPWYPTALFDARFVSWSAVDSGHARATLRLGDLEVSGLFEFGPDGLPLRVTAERFTAKGDLRPWGGVYRSFRTVSGMRLPFEVEVTWQLDAGPFTYAHWLVDSMEYGETVGARAEKLAPVTDGSAGHASTVSTGLRAE